MKRYFALLLLAVSLNAGAEHHRGHVVASLEKVSAGIVAVSTKVAAFNAQTSISHLSQAQQDQVTGSIAIVISRCDTIQSDIVDMLVLLNDASLPVDALNDVRDIINSPNTSSASTLREFNTIMLNLQVLIVNYDELEPVTLLGGAMYYLNHAWKDTDFAAWHVNDAIREEIYNDPDFQ